MKQHDHKILSFYIHKNCGVNWMKVKSTFNEIKPLYFIWYLHSNFPILKNKILILLKKSFNNKSKRFSMLTIPNIIRMWKIIMLLTKYKNMRTITPQSAISNKFPKAFCFKFFSSKLIYIFIKIYLSGNLFRSDLPSILSQFVKG